MINSYFISEADSSLTLIEEKAFNKLTNDVSHHIETSQLVCIDWFL